MPQLCTPHDLAARSPRTRAPECGPDDRARRAKARSDAGFAAQEAQLSPGATERVTGEDRRGMGVGAGVARLVSPNPRVNMRAVTDLAGEMTDLVQFYREHAVGSLEMVADQRANVARLNMRDFRGTIREAIRLGRTPASVLPPTVGATSSAERRARAASTMASWCACGVQPRALNQSAKRAGRAGGSNKGSGAAVPATAQPPRRRRTRPWRARSS